MSEKNIGSKSRLLQLVERLQREAEQQGKISLLDILIQFVDRLDTAGFGADIGTMLYHRFLRLRMRGMATIQARPLWYPGMILMLAVEPTHMAQMLPVATALRRKGDNKVMFITTRIRLYRLLRKAGMPVSLLGGTSGKAGDLFLPLSTTYELCGREHRAILRRMISLFYPDVVALGHDLQHVLDLGRPGYILVGNDLTWEGRLLSRLARRQNYRLGMIQHGLVGHERINGYHIVNDFFVYGPASKTVLEEDGLENVNIVVSGAPYLDEIRVDDADEPHPLIRERLRLPGRFVLVALSGFGHRTSLENYQLTLEWIDRLIRSHPELDFVIKLHRKEQMGAYSMFSDEQKVRIIDSKRGRRYPQSIFDWLRGCSCLITGTSTVAYEAMLFNIPVISVDPVKQFKGVDFVEQRAAEVVHSYDELEQALLRVNGKRGLSDEFIRKIFGGNEVPASEQIASFIVNALGNQQN